MREMILRLALLCIGTTAVVLAAPHLPQTINCPNSDIHVYINKTAVDRSEYTFVDWNAANLQDCVEKCFGNHFCYSIRFDASLDQNCGLYYFAAYNCSNQVLTKASTIGYTGGSITLDCIRCPGRGEFVTAPPFSSVGEQTIVSETAVLAQGQKIKGTATEITHNAEHEGKTHGEAEAPTNKQNAEGTKGEVEGSGAATPTEGAPSGGEKPVEEPTASTETTLTGQEPAESEGGSTSAPSAESSDATTANPEETATGEGSTEAPETVSTPAGGSEEAGSTVAPGAESGSTPSGSESATGEPSTVEGSGQGEEATSPITGESNGEAEFISESSGEGAPGAAPGTAPHRGEVEGSGVEGSGTGPEIAGQEEEEPVKVDVETTTAWNGHTEQPRVCADKIRFVPSSIVDLDTVQLLINSTKANSPAECAKICYEHNCGFAYYEPSTFICQFMANTEDLVDSATCPTEVKDAKYQAEFRTDVASTLTCVTCAKESDLEPSKPALQPVSAPRRGSYPACIISFQAAEGDHSSFPFYKSIQVHGLNECARHCFVGECSQSVYNPKTKECRLGSNPKDTCNNLPIIQKVPTPSEEVLMQCFRCIPEDMIGVKGTVSETTGYREPPTAAESIDEAAHTANREKELAGVVPTPSEPAETTESATEAAPTTEAVPEETTTTSVPSTTEAPITETPTTETPTLPTLPTTEAVPEETTTSEPATTELLTTEPVPTTVAVPEETTTTSEPTTTELLITEPAPSNGAVVEPEAEETTTTSAPSTTELPTTEAAVTEAPTTEVVPVETTATSEPSTTELLTTEAPTTETAVTEAATTEAVPEETTSTALPSTTEVPTTVETLITELPTTENPTTELPTSTVIAATETPTTVVTETEETTTIAGSGAEVDLTESLPQGVTEKPEEDTTSSNATETTTGEEEITTIGGPEVDLEEASGEEATTSAGESGSTTTGYEPTTATNGETEAAEGENGEHKATTTVEATEGSGEGEEGASTVAPGGESKDAESATAAGKEGEEAAATTVAGEESTTEEGEAATTVGGEEATTVAGEETTVGGEEGATTEAAEGSSTLTAEEGATTEAGAESSTLSAEEAATSEGPGEMSKAIEANDQPLILASEDLDFGKSCVIKFQAAPFSARPSTLVAPFEKAFSVDSIELCATRCFQDGCTSAKYEPETRTCHLAYDDKPICDRTELQLRMKEVTGETWIHCVNCYPEKSVVKDVLGAPLSKNTTGEEKEGEGKSMLDKVIGAVSDVAHTVAESVTGEKADTVLRHGCIVNFQTSPSSEMGEAVEYLPPFKTRYAHRCATKCFQEGCAAASFNPTTNECSLGYGKFVKCNNKPLVTTALDIKETVTIHCMSCIHHKSGDGGVDLVVLSPDDARIHVSESQDVPAEEVEGSGAEEVATVPSVAGAAESTTEAGAEVSTEGGGEATTEAGTEATTESGAEGSTVSEEATTEAGEEGTTVAGGESTTGPSTEGTTVEGATTTAEGSGEVNGGTLGEEGSGELEKEGRGRISEVPLASGADGVEIPAGVNLEETAIGKVQVNGEKDEESKFKPQLPTGFSIDSGLGKVQVDGKMPEGDKGAASGTIEKPETVTGTGVVEAGAGEGSTAAPTESSTAEGTESSTGLTTGEEATTTAATEESTATPSESSTTAGGESSTPSGEESSSTAVEHPTMHPAKEFDHMPLHPAGEEVEVGSAETTTGKGEEGETSTTSSSSTESGATTGATTGEHTTTAEAEEESPAFVQGSASEDEEEEKEGLAIADDLKHREGLVEKALGAGKPTVAGGESTTGSTEKPSAAEAVDAEKTTTVSGVEEPAAGKSTVAPVGAESTTAPSTAEPTTTSSWDTPTGELDAMAATDGEMAAAMADVSTTTPAESTTAAVSDETATTTPSESTTAAVSDETATTAATADLQHREGILEKALATANPALTTKEGEEGASSTPSSASTDASHRPSTVEPTTESTEAASSTEGTVAEGAETTVAASTEGTVATESGESSTVAASTEGTVGESTVTPAVEGMAESIDEKTKEEPKEVEEELAHKGEVKETGEKGVSAASLDTGSSTLAPSDVSGSTASATDAPTTAVPSPADLAKAQHHEKGGAEFGQTGQKGTNEKEVEEEPAVKGEVKGTHGASTASSIDTSSTVAPSDTEGSTSASESDAASGELTTSSSVDAGGLAREGEAESTTSSASETTAESTTGASEGSSTVSSVEGAESSTPSSEGGESSTLAASESHDEDKEGILQKALAGATPLLTTKEGGVGSTTAVPSPADLAKSQHHEKGGAEFGQTGEKGTNEKEIGAQEDEIKSTTIKSVEATSGESLDGGIDSALSAIGEKTTTEPPVQAVKDLLDALASGDFDRALLGKKNGTDAEQALKGKTQITDVATPINQKHECSTGKLRFSTFELVDLTTKFEADAIAFSLPHCARLCYEVGCTMAAYSRFPRPLCLMHFEKDEKESHRCNGETNRTSHWEYSSLQQVVAIDCILCEGQTFFEHDHTVDITTLHAIDDSVVTVPSPQGISKNCDGGRLEFQFVPAGSLPRLNVTNDVPARTPADCARKCHETKGCTTAGFIPTPSLEIANGVCLLTSDDEVCISREDAVPQHASVTAFVISCIRCTRCSYTLSHMTLSSSTAKFQHISTVKTIGECAEVCNDKKCVFAQYDATTNTCALSMEATLESGCNKVEPSLAVKGAYPVRLECVQCKE